MFETFGQNRRPVLMFLNFGLMFLILGQNRRPVFLNKCSLDGGGEVDAVVGMSPKLQEMKAGTVPGVEILCSLK